MNLKTQTPNHVVDAGSSKTDISFLSFNEVARLLNGDILIEFRLGKFPAWQNRGLRSSHPARLPVLFFFSNPELWFCVNLPYSHQRFCLCVPCQSARRCGSPKTAIAFRLENCFHRFEWQRGREFQLEFLNAGPRLKTGDPAKSKWKFLVSMVCYQCVHCQSIAVGQHEFDINLKLKWKH